jgi:hypothetical protein
MGSGGTASRILYLVTRGVEWKISLFGRINPEESCGYTVAGVDEMAKKTPLPLLGIEYRSSRPEPDTLLRYTGFWFTK